MLEKKKMKANIKNELIKKGMDFFFLIFLNYRILFYTTQNICLLKHFIYFNKQ